MKIKPPEREGTASTIFFVLVMLSIAVCVSISLVKMFP